MNKISKQPTEIAGVSNDAKDIIEHGIPYIVRVSVVGAAPILFHRWSNEAVLEKSKAAKGSKAKKSDDIESFVYRNDEGQLCIPGEYFRQAVIHAAKFRQDPRSPRKSAMDLYKAGVVSITDLAPINNGVKNWDYEDRRRVLIQRNAITRTRPAFHKGWTASFELQILLPEYIDSLSLRDVIDQAGRLVGVADFRPSHGRFGITSFSVQSAL